MRHLRLALVLSLSLSLAACYGKPSAQLPDTGDTGEAGPDPTDQVYDPDHLLRVEINIDEDDWDELRTQARDFWDILGDEDCQADAYGSPFTYFHSDVTIDGELFTDVGVRKKGFLGSLSEEKPALKIDLSEYGGVAEFSRVERLTLNNAISDPAYLRQCIGYGFYRDAGMPASRCNYATVAVNGQELGVYANVEPLKKALLRRYFDDDEGNLYEGTLSDFREGWTGTFEKKTNEDEDDWSDIEAMVAALQAGDDQLLDALDPILDLDAFYTHWAAEVISTHVDGYAWNTNNFYLYADPADGRFHFLPWGIDAAFLGPENMEGSPASVYAYGQLAHRLYSMDDTRTAYLSRLEELLGTAWDEDTLHARLDRDAAIVLDALDPDLVSDAEAAIDSLRAVIDDRRPAITEELAEGGDQWPYELRESFCFQIIGEMTATFDTTWGSVETQDVFTYGDAALEVLWEEELITGLSSGAVAGLSEGQALVFMASWISDYEAMIAYYAGPSDYFAPGSVETGFGESIGALFYIDTLTMEDFELVSYVMGTMEFEQAGTESGDAIVGTLTGELMTWGW